MRKDIEDKQRFGLLFCVRSLIGFLQVLPGSART